MAKKEKVGKEKKQTSYFKEMKAELKKVVWPTPKELFNNTVAVIVFVLIIAVIVFVLDFCFDNLNKYGITRLQEKVQSSLQTTENSSEQENSTSDENVESDENSLSNVEAEVDGNDTTNQEGQENSETNSTESNE